VKKQTPGQKVRSKGISSLAEVSDMTGQSIQTLSNWHYNKEKLFDVVLAGVIKLRDEHQACKDKHDKEKRYENYVKH
jgi:hypothetical protein